MTIRLEICLEPALKAFLAGIWPVSAVEGKLDRVIALQEGVTMKLSDFEARITKINENTTASAAAATAAAESSTKAVQAVDSIKTQLDTLRQQIKDMGLSSEQEQQLLDSLDNAAAGTDTVKSANEAIKTANEALATYLEQVGSGAEEPEPVPANV